MYVLEMKKNLNFTIIFKSAFTRFCILIFFMILICLNFVFTLFQPLPVPDMFMQKKTTKMLLNRKEVPQAPSTVINQYVIVLFYTLKSEVRAI